VYTVAKFFTFDPTHNPGRSSGWSVRVEAVRLADAGANGLAGLILRDGFSQMPAASVAYEANTDGMTLAPLCAEILAGLATRTSESGTVKPILNGTPLALFQRRLDDIAKLKGAGVVIDGRRRTVASIIAYGCGKDAVEMQGVKLDNPDAEAAFIINGLVAQAAKLDPWAKVEAGVRVLSGSPSMSEAELMKVLQVKRGDAQLIHRGASAMIMHGLRPDVSKRCPSKEEWTNLLPDPKGERATPTAAEAASTLVGLQTDTRAKALGVDQISKALSMLQEGTLLDARQLANACKDRKAFDAFLASIVKPT
jgi:hypothetical protein